MEAVNGRGSRHKPEPPPAHEDGMKRPSGMDVVAVRGVEG